MARYLLIVLTGLVLVAGCSRVPESESAVDIANVDATPIPVAVDVVRPKFRLDSDEVFAAASIDSYPSSHDAVYAHIDENLDQHIAEIRRWIRQPSVSAQNIGIHEMATLLRDDLTALGFAEAELVEHELGTVLVGRSSEEARKETWNRKENENDL